MIVEKSPPSNPEVASPSTPNNGHADRSLFDIVAAAAYVCSIGATGVSPKCIYNLMASGEVPRIKIGKKFFVSKRALDEWLIRHERRAR
jgi:predicted DNA-binding transcriptional regulator AlpA